MGYAEVIVAAVSVLAGWYLGVRSERMASIQYKLSASGFAADWFRDLRSWASEAIDVLSEAAYLAPGRSDSKPINPEDCNRCRYRLSALIDRGRFFIPNYVPDAVGPNKPSAFRGLRHPALDYLVAAEQLLAGTAPDLSGSFPSARAALVSIKRHFVSQIQEVLDPRTQNRAIAELVRASRGDTADTRSAFERLAQDELPDFSGDGAVLHNKGMKLTKRG
jgi:hypothetical protein